MKKLVLLMLFLAVTVLSISCSDIDELTTGTIQRIWDENDPRINGAIHRVEYGENVAYIFGTFHASRDGWFPLADVVEDALRRSDVLLIEVEEIGEGENAFFQPFMTAIRYLPKNLTWIEYLPEDAYNHLVETLATWQLVTRQNLVYDRINTTNPMFLLYNLEAELGVRISDVHANFEDTVDMYIANIARELEMPIVGLKSTEQQFNLLLNPPFEVMVARIMSFLPPDGFLKLINEQTSLDDLLDIYESNDFIGFINSFATGLGVDHECLYVTYFRENVSVFRSTYFAHEIIRLLQETEEPTTFFVAVGMAHILSSGGGEEFTDIIQQLELAGLTVIS